MIVIVTRLCSGTVRYVAQSVSISSYHRICLVEVWVQLFSVIAGLTACVKKERREETQEGKEKEERSLPRLR